ncbi:MAG: hypothetical protein ACK5PF_03265, partial [bacterium]
MNKHNLAELAPAAPPTAVTGLHVLGIPLSEVVLILNAVYIVLGIAWLLYKAWRSHDNGRF